MKKLLFTALFLGSSTLLSAQKATKTPAVYKPVRTEMYKKGWIDLNKNGIKDVYEDPTATIDARIEDLLSQMTLEEKTCQMVTLYGYKRVLKDDLPTPEWKNQLWKDGIGAIDEHLNGFQQWGLPPSDNENIWPASRHAWALNEVQRFFIEETRLGIPTDFTNEGIRGVESYKATNFPTGAGTYLESPADSPSRADHRTGSTHVGIYQCVCTYIGRRSRPTLGTLRRSIRRVSLSGCRTGYRNGTWYATQPSDSSNRKALYRL